MDKSMQYSFTTTIFTLFILLFSCSADNKNSSENIAIKNLTKPLDMFIEKNMEETGIVGLSAAIIVDNKVVWLKGYGYADKENKTPFTENTIMNIASISKTFTGASIMKAVEDDILSLDEDINNYLPFKVVNPYYPNNKITLRHLATHTSSLADDYDVYDKTYYYSKKPEDLGKFLKNYYTPNGKYYSKKNFLDKKPGFYRDYSNIAAGLAGYILEIKTGIKLNKYSKKNIFKPLSMSDTGWFLSEIDLKNHSKQYEKTKNSTKTIPLFQLVTYPDGGVRTSVSSLSKFFIALLNDGEYEETRILKKETVHEMLRLQFTKTNKPENINIKVPNKNSGIFWSTKRDVTRVGHGGSDFGVSTSMFCNLKKEFGVILLSNTSEADTYDIYSKLWETAEKINELQK